MADTLTLLETLSTHDISAVQARAVVDAAKAKAAELNTKMNIAVADAGGNIKAFLRMDGAWLGSIDIAIKKARTARLFDMPTGEIGKLSQPGGPLYNIEHSNDGLISFPGGLPLTQRYSMLVEDGVVTALHVEEAGAFAVSDAETLLGDA